VRQYIDGLVEYLMGWLEISSFISIVYTLNEKGLENLSGRFSAAPQAL
jgi:hypothetical protein